MLFIINRRTTDVNILIDNVIIYNEAPKSKILFSEHLTLHNASAFGFYEKWRATT